MDVYSPLDRFRAESPAQDGCERLSLISESAAREANPWSMHPHPGPLPEGEGDEHRHPGPLLATASLRPEGEGSVADPLPKGKENAARGVGWVMRWAAALGVLAWSASVLVEFGYSVAAEQTLARAARAGAMEATLPRATSHSIEQVIWKRLDERAIPRSGARIALAHNGAPVAGAFHPRPGDHVSITLSVSSKAVLPGWLQAVTAWSDGQPIIVRSERELPGRALNAAP
jgi:hypothetical protein